MQHFRSPDARRFVTAALTIGVAFVVFGASFGVLSVSAGASVLQTCALSFFVFTGASQMSAVSVIAAGGSPASALGGAILLSARNAVYGLALSPVIRGSWASRLLGAHWVIDETTAVVSVESGADTKRTAFWISGSILFASWNLGTLIGALAGTTVNPEVLGLDAAFPVMFTAMLVPHLRSTRGRRAALFGGVSTVVLAPFLPVGLPILVSALGILFGLPPDAPDEGDEQDRAGLTDGAP